MIKGQAYKNMNNRQRQRPQRPPNFRTVATNPAHAIVEFIDRGQKNWAGTVQKTSISGDKVTFLLHSGEMKVFNFQEIFSIDLKPLETDDGQNRSNPR